MWRARALGPVRRRTRATGLLISHSAVAFRGRASGARVSRVDQQHLAASAPGDWAVVQSACSDVRAPVPPRRSASSPASSSPPCAAGAQQIEWGQVRDGVPPGQSDDIQQQGAAVASRLGPALCSPLPVVNRTPSCVPGRWCWCYSITHTHSRTLDPSPPSPARLSFPLLARCSASRVSEPVQNAARNPSQQPRERQGEGLRTSRLTLQRKRLLPQSARRASSRRKPETVVLPCTHALARKHTRRAHAHTHTRSHPEHAHARTRACTHSISHTHTTSLRYANLNMALLPYE